MPLLAPRSSAGRRFAPNMSASDALLWTIERDPCLRSTIVAVSILDRAPQWEALRRRIAAAAEQIPRMRQKVTTGVPGLTTPRWRADPNFDIDYHVRRVSAPAPGDIRSALDIAGLAAMDAFDKDRPLWEFTMVEGLAGGTAAFVQKVHHSVTDGVGAVQLATAMLDPRRHPKSGDTKRPTPSDAETTASPDIVQRIVRDATNTGKVIAHEAQRALADPTLPFSDVARQAKSIGKLIAPVTTPLSPVMTGRGMSRRLDVFDVDLDELRAAGHAASGSLNDAFLAAVTGGMRRYHEVHHAAVPRLRVTMPINIRRAGDTSGSNRFTPVRFALPIDTADPAERIRQLGALAQSWRHEPALPLTDVIAGGLVRLPAPATSRVFGAMLKAIDFVATNVPGLREPMYLTGAKLTAQYAFAPASGAAFSIALLSHLDRCCIGINADLAAVRDPETLTTCLQQGFDEVLTGTRP